MDNCPWRILVVESIFSGRHSINSKRLLSWGEN